MDTDQASSRDNQSSVNFLDQASAQLFQCSLCLDEYNSPKALPCLHTYCAKCLYQHVQVAKSRGYKDTFECPQCRIATKLPNGGPLAFPDNFLINSARDLFRDLKFNTEKEKEDDDERKNVEREKLLKCLDDQNERVKEEIDYAYKKFTRILLVNQQKDLEDLKEATNKLKYSISNSDNSQFKAGVLRHNCNFQPFDYSFLEAVMETRKPLLRIFSTFKRPKLKYIFNVTCDWLMDMSSYEDNLILVKRISSHRGTVAKFSEDGVELKDLYGNIPARCAIVGKTLYVTDWVDNFLQVIDLTDKDKTVKSIEAASTESSSNPFNLINCGNCLMVLHHKSADGLATILGPTWTAQIQKALPEEIKFHWYACHVTGSTIAVTDKEESCVRFVRVDKAKSLSSVKVKEGLLFPAGMCNDVKSCRILLADRQAGRIQILSYDGEIVGELLNKEDGLKEPRLVHINEVTNSLYVGEQDGTVRVYEYLY
ncbi:unnamed protein product [Dimorphilus gyrociliatus]|uniref:RING-type domain-containing protein n=1 Tax=Dimorphilus gyrociliatus TaxID=2664684 RepID=A0A7I8WDU7_9ANNE|nr:unnamed protein product [Dimorphilus gyrociliatus]